MRWLVFALSLVPSLALAQPWAGVPLERLPSLGLGEPVLDEVADRWRAGLSGGGFVTLSWYPDEATAVAAFQTTVQVAASRVLPRIDDHTAGDERFRVVRVDNVVLAVRSHAGQAPAVVERLRAALVSIAPPGERTVTVDGRTLRWDAVGRRVD